MEAIAAAEPKFEDRITKIAAAMDEFEGYAHPHAHRIAAIAEALAQRFNMADHDRRSLRHASLIHDIGELVMDRDYIHSPRVLRPEERLDMQRHPVIGEQEASKRGLDRAVQLLIRWHHEWWNGTGYPDALEHDQIPLAARILRVADTFCALTDSRPYSDPISTSEAKRYLSEWAGIEFDPRVVKAFLSLEGLDEIRSFAEAE